MSDTLISTLKALKLFGMADTLANLAEQASPLYQQTVPILEMLLRAEVAEREVRSINYQMKTARFPAYRDLAGFEFGDSQVDEGLVKSSLRPPDGVIYLLVDDGDIVAGMGAIRKVSDEIGEIKRMYIRPLYRGRGYGK